MVQNVSKPTYFGSGHVLDSKLASEPCKQFCFGCRIDPEHDQNLDTFLKLYIRVHIHILLIPLLVNRRYKYIQV